MKLLKQLIFIIFLFVAFTVSSESLIQMELAESQKIVVNTEQQQSDNIVENSLSPNKNLALKKKDESLLEQISGLNTRIEKLEQTLQLRKDFDKKILQQLSIIEKSYKQQVQHISNNPSLFPESYTSNLPGRFFQEDYIMQEVITQIKDLQVRKNIDTKMFLNLSNKIKKIEEQLKKIEEKSNNQKNKNILAIQ